MNGVGKQTNSSHDSKKRSVITKMDDGKGIGRRVSESSRGTQTEEARKRLTLLNGSAINPFLPAQIRDKGN